jgi:hypothetical protein
MGPFIVLGCLVIAGCASGGAASGRSQPAPAAPSMDARVAGSEGAAAPVDMAHSTTVVFRYDTVFHVLPAVYAALGMPVRAADVKQYVLGTQGMKVHSKLGKVPLSRYIDCGSAIQGMASADTYDVVLTVTTRVKAIEAGGSDVATTVIASAKPPQYSSEYMRCGTKGVLEARIIELVNETLKK